MGSTEQMHYACIHNYMNKGVTGIQKKDNQNTWGKHKIHGNDQLFMVLLQYTYVTLCTCLKYSSYFQI